ncbi:hypothetical protein [Actinomadura verrucosospora]|uniref:Uncharacterized protein n=1 Tax=Actinomadura verrucosospora TaxID=46165 RepID=A0A7D3W025_ACTVE|nr:hypothetical protein [Actinomadura verrucosospora]QKG23256.1 hypothetical protein ACTIVE_4899 [Actinomadura verrucosospora]
MAATTGGTDFWATLGVDKQPVEEPPEEPAEQEPEQGAPDRWVAGTADGEAAARAGERQAASGAQAEWASMFSDGIRAPEPRREPQPAQPSPEAPVQPEPADDAEPQAAEPENTGPQNIAPQNTGPQKPGPQNTGPQNTGPMNTGPQNVASESTGPQSIAPQGAEPRVPPAPSGGGDAGPPADPAWVAAERIAASAEARLSETWLEVLMKHTNGDRVLAGRVYQVLRGQHLLGELWLDKRINEVHVRGTRVTVCAADGVYEVPGFPSRASARKAVAAIEGAQAELGAIVTQVGDSYVVSRPYDTGPGAESLVASGVVTQELLERVRDALQRLQAVTVSGPAARIVVRAFASLIPSGSRVFVGPFMVLPSGCIAAKGPLDADYVTGVRPGAVAEDMAAAGQVGALIANPETQFGAAVRLIVTGRSLAPEKVALH